MHGKICKKVFWGLVILGKISIAIRGALATLNLLRQKDYKERHEHLSTSIKKHICELQGQLAEYFFLGGEHHKNLRMAVQDYKAAVTEKQHSKLTRAESRDIRSKRADVKKRLGELESFLKNGQAKACKTTFDSLSSYFLPRKKENYFEPRFCIKLVKGGNVFAFSRSTGSGSKQQPMKDAIESNSGFKYIAETGNFYFCNDIPSAAKQLSYMNPRLRSEAVGSYENSLLWKIKHLFSFSEPCPDMAWVNCWNANIDNGQVPHPEQCYKSTLIVPMTLKHDQVSGHFWDMFNGKSNGNFEKGSFGFLCLDCHEKDFFERDIDSRVGYVFADLLSLFFVATYTFSSLSETYKEAISLIEVAAKSGSAMEAV